MKPTSLILICCLALGGILSACHDTLVERSDHEVYTMLQERQKAALGTSYNVRIDETEPEPVIPSAQMYSFTPRPAENELPEPFRHSAKQKSPQQPAPDEPGQDPAQPAPQPPQPESTQETSGSAPAEPTTPQDPAGAAPAAHGAAMTGEPAASGNLIPPSIFTAEQIPNVLVFSLSDALAYAARHAREFQDAKEDLYLAGLDLTLERHLWTPQWVASIQSEYANYGQVRDFDRAMAAVADVAVTQRLPYGGEVSARVVNSLMRDLGVHTTSGESGNFIMAADIPLFRGAGKVAYESRYAAERELIYAVRTFESFRRSYLVDIAADYFDLQQGRTAIANAHQSYISRKEDLDKAEMVSPTSKNRSVSDLPRAKSSFRSAEATLVSAKEQHESALDRFKIRIGMDVKSLLDVVDQNEDTESETIETLIPDVDEGTSIEAALRYRLDLLTSADQVDDARRGVLVARNRILPDLNATGSAALDTDPEHLNSTSYNTERTTWRAGLELRMDDRKRERTEYRAAVINVRQEERRHKEAEDSVRADVRRALRRVRQQAQLREIQQLNVEENQFRAEMASALYDLGQSTNQDKIDAEIDLLNARNEYAAAVAAYRSAILEFRRDTGTLRIDEVGKWFVQDNTAP